MIRQWLELVAQGKGYYDKRPIIPAERTELLTEAEDQAYSVTLYNVKLDWRAFCDADPDSLFGGDQLMTQFEEADVTLFFRTKDLSLCGFYAAVPDGMEAGWALTPSAVKPADMPESEIIEAVLYEQWDVLGLDE